MSVEAPTMSVGPTIATAINTGPVTPSFGGEFSAGIRGPQSFGATQDVGGTHLPGFNNAALFETFEMAPPLESSVGGKAMHDVSPFQNTQVLWSAPSGPKVESSILENSVSDLKSETIPLILSRDTMSSPVNPPISQEIVSQILNEEKQQIIEPPTDNTPIAQADIVTENILQINENKVEVQTIKPRIIEQLNDVVSEIQENIVVEPESIVNPHILSKDVSIPQHDETVQQDKELSAETVREPESAVEEFIATVSTTEPEAKTDEVTMPTEITQQEIVADAKQAIKVEEALVATGATKEEAHEEALKAFQKTEEKKGLVSTSVKEKPQQTNNQKLPLEDAKELNAQKNKIKPKESYFEHDTKADEARKKIAASAVERVAKEIADGKKEGDTVTGYDIVEHMPKPQPDVVKSEIAKDKDGSYESFVGQLGATGVVSSTEEAEKIVEQLIKENHAVRVTNILKASKATEGEIKKVLRSAVIFDKKIT